MSNIVISIDGGRDAKAKLKRLGKELHDFNKAMGKIGTGLADYYSSVPFLSEGSVYGRNWRPLKAATVRQKNRRYPGRGILQRTLTMQNGFVAEHGATFARVSNRTNYFKYLQGGTKNMPARTIMAINKANVTLITEVLRADIKDKIRRA